MSDVSSVSSRAIDAIWQDICAVRSGAPLVHSITNLVVMAVNANALLAAGAAPVMAHALPEVGDMARLAGALVVNIGTLEPEWVDSMEAAMCAARDAGKPIVLDPVGAGATAYRNQVLARLLAAVSPTVIRGNASEIMALAGQAAAARGVDSQDASSAALEAARALAQAHNAVVCVSGATDYVLDGSGRCAALSNGDVWMTRMTGTGCSASALVGAFCAVQGDPWRATVSAMSLTALAGELGARRARAAGLGVGSLQALWLDALQGLSRDELVSLLRMEGFRNE
ncbi:hydroxyethylthiazole kinase [Paludibacterium yongneupense]|uniref:hydroxyethylthiazole kinase n=1 Tax=Paludibacterium yongneupense TaxID=400061 RepID=UPI000413CEFA|nr:hydroxyethylthiazole kinase [Paludibacterium yongneupense]